MSAEPEALTALKRVAEQELGVPAVLHAYQWEGIAFLYRSHSALLADEMGLGKTVQAAVALTLLLNGQRGFQRALIVAPASLTQNWMNEIAVWAPSITARKVVGDARAREAFYLLPIPVLVTSYEYVRFDALDRIPVDTFDLVVLDEAQRIKNRESATSFACKMLSRKRSWALSATPLENEPEDVRSILGFLESTDVRRRSPRQLAEHLRTIMLRRRKAEVRAELPPVLIQDLELDLSDAQRRAYDALWFERADVVRSATREDAGTQLLALITRLKVVCNLDEVSASSSKLDALRSIIQEAGTDARILVFSQFVKTLSWISHRLSVSHDMVIGSMPTEARQQSMERFRNAASPRVLLVSLRAGGVGLNLGEATHVILFDRWWNPAVVLGLECPGGDAWESAHAQPFRPPRSDGRPCRRWLRCPDHPG